MLEQSFAQDHIRHDWQKDEILGLYTLPMPVLMSQAHQVHQLNHVTHEVQISKLLSIKTGACPEDCKYCSQSGFHTTDIDKHKLLSKSFVLSIAKKAKEKGATRFCMAAAWRTPPEKNMPELQETIRAVKELGMETCLSAGMLNDEQAEQFKAAGLDYYNHNLDTSPEYYPEVISSRTYQDRLHTLDAVEKVGMKTCCGGIMGLGESREDRISFLQQLSNRKNHPESVPLNILVPIPGTPLAEVEPINSIEFVRTVATARILMPKTQLRLSAGRHTMSDELHCLCFYVGANSIHSDQKLLTTPLPESHSDAKLLKRLGLSPLQATTEASEELCT